MIISPAKKMVVDRDSLAPRSVPQFLSQTKVLLETMQTMTPQELQHLWGCNDAIARLNVQRLETMELEGDLTPAILSYQGIQYQYMAPGVLENQALDYLQDHLRILSGFYGVLRPFDGGMMQNPNRLELMTADSVIGTYIRTSIWITALCAERQNLAITGKPEFQAKTFRKVPPIIDTESRFLNTYVRNWSMVNAALGTKAPASLKSAIRELKNIPVEQGCRFKLINVVNNRALPIAKAIMEIPGVDQLTRATCAEMILGMDVRIFFEPKRNDGNPQPGEYSLNVDIQQPLGGRALGLHRDKEQEGKANSAYKYDFAGTVQFSDTTPSPPWKPFPGRPIPNSAANGTSTPTRRNSAAPPSRACKK